MEMPILLASLLGLVSLATEFVTHRGPALKMSPARFPLVPITITQLMITQLMITHLMMTRLMITASMEMRITQIQLSQNQLSQNQLSQDQLLLPRPLATLILRPISPKRSGGSVSES